MIKLIVVNSSRQKIRKREQKEKRKDRWEDRNCCADIKTEHSWPRQCNPYQCNLIKYNYNQSFVYHSFFICISYFPIVKSSILFACTLTRSLLWFLNLYTYFPFVNLFYKYASPVVFVCFTSLDAETLFIFWQCQCTSLLASRIKTIIF